MKEGFEPKSFKNYNLTPEEQKELDKFLDENLEKGYIWLSQSPQASPFFFVKKKDGRLRPCQDYQYMNDWMVENTYCYDFELYAILSLYSRSVLSKIQ
jgi:hypothetical protein